MKKSNTICAKCDHIYQYCRCNQINMVPCIRCGKEYADEMNDGVCEICIPQIEVDMAIADIYTAITVLISHNQDIYTKNMKDVLVRASKQLDNLVEKL